ncbi:MAG: TonB-dependent receptor [Myxococcota bacterium]
MLSISLLLALAGAPPDAVKLQADEARPQPSDASVARSLIDVFVFENGAPVPGIEARVGESSLGKTDDTGGLSVQIPSGRQMFRLFRGEAAVVELDLLTDAGEIVQIIATLQGNEKPQLDIENSGRAVLAGERLAERAQQEQPEAVEKQPPGALRGTIISIEEQKPVVDARVFFSGTRAEATTDKEGRFAIELPAGSYSVSVVHPDFATQTKDNIRVIPAREVTLTLELTPAGLQLQDYIVTAPYVEGSIASTIEAQRETSAVSEVLGAEQMAAAGDSDAASALSRVSGLTIEQGKYVLVRGQPFRFTYNLWNNSPLPSPEPLLRVVPLDLFPTGVLAGIEVQKSYSPDRPAEFGAGLINLQTRGIPDEAFISLTVSGGYNSESTFTQGLSYDGGSTDFLGFDDGTRAMPDSIRALSEGGVVDLNGVDPEVVNAAAMDFSDIYQLKNTTLPPDFGLAIAAGGSVDIFADGRLGAIASLKLSNRWREQDRIERRYSLRQENTPDAFLDVLSDLRENRTDFNSDLGGLLTIEADWGDHVFTSNTFYAHQTQQRSQLVVGDTTEGTAGTVRNFELSWIDRTLIAQQLTAKHDFEVVKIEYRGMYAAGIRDSPDRRAYSYINDEEGPDVFTVNGNGATRRFNSVDDTVVSGGLDFTWSVLPADDHWFGLDLKVGGAVVRQDRESATQTFQFIVDDENGGDVFETNPDVLYDPANIGTSLIFADRSGSSRDDYIGSLNVWGVYGMADIRLGDIVRIVAGARYEQAKMDVTTFQGDPDDDNAVMGGFEQKEPYPAVSATWFILEELQLRAAYARTTSRPNLNELSDARFIDPDTGEGFVGDAGLLPTLIDGADVRLEWYPTPTETVTLGAFWKGYNDPIERTVAPVSGTSDLFSFQNARSATVIGVEFGGRVQFTHIREWLDGPEFLDDVFLSGNVAILDSEVELVVTGAGLALNRPLDGQADFTINAQAGYSGEEHDITIAYNHVGTRLHRAAPQFDIFLQPVASLNVTWTWRIWDGDTAGTLRLKGANLLNPTFEWLRGDEVWRSFKRGVSTSASFKITF